ncbi:MAG: DUF6046 domain-containing protein [Bacteroidales bacterium]
MMIDVKSRLITAFGYFASVGLSRVSNDGLNVKKNPDDTYGLEGFDMQESNMDEDEVELYLDDESKHYFFAYRSLGLASKKEVFATPPMLTFRRKKRLVVSVIDNTDTEVVERYGTEPWEITWKALLIDMENHVFPLDKMESINEMFEQNAIWNVSSVILGAVNVSAVYIKDVEISFVEGYEDTIAYTLTLRSIKPLSYQLVNQN